MGYLSYVLEFARFGIVGLLGMAAYYAIYIPCVRSKREWYVLWASLAFLGLIGVSFPLHKYWTFENIDPDVAKFQLTVFVFQRLGFQVFNTFILRTLVKGFRPFVFEKRIGRVQMHEISAQVTSHLLLAVPSYLITKLIFLPI